MTRITIYTDSLQNPKFYWCRECVGLGAVCATFEPELLSGLRCDFCNKPFVVKEKDEGSKSESH